MVVLICLLIFHRLAAPKNGIIFDMDKLKATNSMERYGHSKLANILYTKGTNAALFIYLFFFWFIYYDKSSTSASRPRASSPTRSTRARS